MGCSTKCCSIEDGGYQVRGEDATCGRARSELMGVWSRKVIIDLLV